VLGETVRAENVQSQRGQLLAWMLCAAIAVWTIPSLALAQGAGTATVRGTVSDSSGGILPGASVTIVNSGTKESRTATTDDRGGFAFPSLFPGNYELKAELQGFKSYDVKNLVLSPNDTRGLDVQLEVGSITEVVSVASPVEIIRTETGAREGVIRAEQIENLSVVGRSSLELLRILPGVVTPDNSQFEQVSFGGGANNTQGYTVNGIRSSGNQVSLDGSSLIDIGSNSGVIVTLNNDMVQEVKVQSSNFAAEYGTGGMNISAVTKSGSSQFHGVLYDYDRDYRFAANDRSNSIAGVKKPKSQYQFPGGSLGGPVLLPGTSFNKDRNKAFFFVAFEVQRQQIDDGSRFGVVPTLKQRQGDFSEFLSANGQNLNQPTGQLNIPLGYAGAGTPAPNNNLAPYLTPLGKVLANAYPAPNYVDPNNRYNYVFNQLRPTNRTDLKMRFDYNISNNTKAYVRMAYEGETTENARGIWWGASDVAIPSPDVGTNKGRSYSGNIVTVLSPSMTNEALVSWSRLTLDDHYKDPSKMSLSSYGVALNTSFPGASPYIPGVVNWGGAVSNMWSAANDMYAHNDALQFSDKLTKIAGAHGLKFGVTVERLQKQQNFNNTEEGRINVDNNTAGGTGSAIANLLVGRLGEWNQGTRPPNGEFRMWNLDAFAQDQWKLRSNLTLEFGVRGGYWTNNHELNGLGGVFTPSMYDPTKPEFTDPGTFRQLNGVCYVSTGCAPAGLLPNRSPFVMPRLNMAWDIDGQGNNLLRGGYGIFYNRNMGNVEYDQTLHLPPSSYNIAVGSNDASSYGNGLGLTYDTVNQATLANRLGTVQINSLTADSFKFPMTHSFSLSYARRIAFDQLVEVGYVGTRGRQLVTQVNQNAVPEGSLLQGVIGNANLADPVERVALDSSAVNKFRPYQSYGVIRTYDFQGTSNYNSLQVTLSRQTGKRLQYFATYTLGKLKGTLGDEYRLRDPFVASRTYGVRNEDRTHIFNLSWNTFLPDAAKGNNPVLRGVLNGWQLSGISTVASGIPIWLGFSGAAGDKTIAQAYYGTPDVVVLVAPGTEQSGLSPVYTCDPRLSSGTGKGAKLLDVNCIGFPALGQLGQPIPPYDLRTPTRINHDITLFKNFALPRDQKIQFRMGVFNIFNNAFASTSTSRDDIALTLDTVCNSYVDNVPNGVGGTSNHVCDPTKGFSLTDNTKSNFSKINLLRGHRTIEFAFKYYF
jgi:hypothetical protein